MASIVRPLVAVVFVLLVADAVYVTFRLDALLHAAGDRLVAAKEAFGDARFTAAGNALENAKDDTEASVSLTRHPSFWLVSLLPGVGSDAVAVRAMADAADLTSQAGLDALEAASTLKVGEEGIGGSIFRDGTVDLDAVTDATPLVSHAADLLGRADAAISGLDAPKIPFVRDALQVAEAEVGEAAGTARKGAALFTSLPRLMGSQSPQRYMLALQALGESRGTGGLIGLYGELRVDDGAVSLTRVGSTKDVLPATGAPVEAPDWFEENYGPQSSLVQFRQVNLTPNFPVAAEVLMSMYEQATGEVLDGVIGLDPIAFEAMLRGTGPLQVAGLDEEVGPDDAAEVMLKRSYEEFSSDAAQSRYLERLVEAFWMRVSSGQIDDLEFAEGVAEAARRNHLKVFSSDAGVQNAMETLGISGSFEQHGPSLQLVFQNNYGRNKVDFFLNRTLDTSIRLSADGVAHVRTTAVLRNDAPPEGVPALLGVDDPEIPPGTNRTQLSLLLPEGSVPRALQLNGNERELYQFEDTGYPVVWTLLDIPPGESAEVTLEYDAPAFFSDDSYEMTLVPQTMTRPDSYSLEVFPPEDFVIRDPDDDDATLDRFVARGALATAQTFRLILDARR